MKTVYISIPMTGLDLDIQRKKAKLVEKDLISRGYEVVNPFDISDELCTQWNIILLKDPDYKAYLLRDLFKLVMKCDAIYMCNDWQKSKGCTAEYYVARAVGLDIMGGLI